MDAADFDIAVVGFGVAGCAAALTAARRGARVALLEKQPRATHVSSTRMSGGLTMAVVDPEPAFDYLHACAGGMIPAAVTRAWVERAAGVAQFMASVGLHTTPIAEGWHPSIRGHQAINVVAIVKDGGAAGDRQAMAQAVRAGALPREIVSAGGYGRGVDFADAFERAVHEHPRISVLYGCRARRLLRDAEQVVGVGARNGAKETQIRAGRGVILTSGGFEFNEEMKLNYLRTYPVHFYGNRHNTGDGIKLAQEVGADLWHMNQMIGKAVAHFELGGEPMNFNIRLDPPGYVIVDKYGRRFANEHHQATSKSHFYYELLAYDAGRFEYTRNPSYWIFDRRRIEAGELVMPNVGLCGVGLYDWSPDNRREIDRGWIAEGATVAQAARRAGVADPEAAQRSVADYNLDCAAGADRHGRPAESLVPIDAPPFYCMAVYPGGASTCGGPRRDERARILSAAGAPIPGLFGAGSLGEAIGQLYPSGGANLSEGLCFGQIAAETALDAF